MSSGVRGGAVSERLQSVRVGGRAVECVESQQRGLKGELRRRRPDPESQVSISPDLCLCLSVTLLIHLLSHEMLSRAESCVKICCSHLFPTTATTSCQTSNEADMLVCIHYFATLCKVVRVFENKHGKKKSCTGRDDSSNTDPADSRQPNTLPNLFGWIRPLHMPRHVIRLY